VRWNIGLIPISAACCFFGGPTNEITESRNGVNPDGTLADGLEAQMERCWLNLFAVLEEARMTKKNLVRITVYVTRSDATALYRQIRDRVLEGHAPAATYIVVAELASPDLLVEIEGEAVDIREIQY
jgi:enamine deaminase RidA (YjgF/YER057c/UK114 family)